MGGVALPSGFSWLSGAVHRSLIAHQTTNFLETLNEILLHDGAVNGRPQEDHETAAQEEQEARATEDAPHEVARGAS